MKLCLLLVCLVATVTATVTPVSTPETTPSGRVKPIRLQPAQTVFPRLWDTGTPTQPVPSSNASTTEEPSLGAVLEALEPLGPVEFVAAPEESGTAANGSVATPEPETTTGPPSTPPDTINPPCPGDEEPAETCWAPTREQKEEVAMALGTFALRFYQHMAESAKPDTNLLFSPVNVALGLSHLLLGARGETQQRLAAILGYQPGLACVHSALQQLVNVSGLLSATEIFHHPDLHLRPRCLMPAPSFLASISSLPPSFIPAFSSSPFHLSLPLPIPLSLLPHIFSPSPPSFLPSLFTPSFFLPTNLPLATTLQPHPSFLPSPSHTSQFLLPHWVLLAPQQLLCLCSPHQLWA
uniref:Serpin family G member 1 n=1 Tax=Gallus gallus TaxID=9031 RepID=A0A8V1AD33_CHICK